LADVLELDKPNEFTLGRMLRVGSSKYQYSDLDELIVSHVRAMARKVDEMMAHDKYKGSETDLGIFFSPFGRLFPLWTVGC
jgi:transcription elongation factor SPT6